MKKILIIAASLALAAVAHAASPTYTTLANNGNAASPASVIFKAAPQQQIRLVSCNWNSDSNTAVLSFTTGVGAYYTPITNAAADTNLYVNTTNGFTASSALVVQTPAGLVTNVTVSSLINATNVGLSAAIGLALPPNSQVFIMSSATTLPVGATTNWQGSEAVYVGSVDRPVRVVLTPALVTNRLNGVTARYE